MSTSLLVILSGKDHVRVELTFHKTLPTLSAFKKRTESRRQPALSAGEWPRQPTAARRPPPPMTRPTPPTHRQPTTPYEGDITTSNTDTRDRHTNNHHTTTEDSTDHAITNHSETSNTAFFSGVSTCQETTNQVAEVHDKTTFTVLPRQDGE